MTRAPAATNEHGGSGTRQQRSGRGERQRSGGTGLVLLTKRLFKGRFARPWAQAGAVSVELTVAELSLFLEGCELAGRWKLSPPAFEEKELAVTLAV